MFLLIAAAPELRLRLRLLVRFTHGHAFHNAPSADIEGLSDFDIGSPPRRGNLHGDGAIRSHVSPEIETGECVPLVHHAIVDPEQGASIATANKTAVGKRRRAGFRYGWRIDAGRYFAYVLLGSRHVELCAL